jgi:hypothetical protein
MPEEQIAEALFDRGILMDLYIGRPTFQKKLKADDVLLEGIDENVLYLGHKKLLPHVATEKLVKLEGQARTALAGRSIPFPISGARFVYYQALPGVLKKLKELKDAWNGAVEDLLKEYPALKEQQLVELDKQAQALYQSELTKVGVNRATREAELNEWLAAQRQINRELYPDVSKVRDTFHFDWRIFKTNAPQGNEEMSTLEQEDLLKAQKQIKEDLQKWVQAASAEMHKTLGQAAANAAKLLEKNNKLDTRNLKPLFEAFENFKAVDFTGASSFHQVVENIKQRFGQKRPDGSYDMELTSKSLKDNPNGQVEFKKLLEGLSGLAVDEVAEKAGILAIEVGGFKRMVEL